MSFTMWTKTSAFGNQQLLANWIAETSKSISGHEQVLGIFAITKPRDDFLLLESNTLRAITQDHELKDAEGFCPVRAERKGGILLLWNEAFPKW